MDMYLFIDPTYVVGTNGFLSKLINIVLNFAPSQKTPERIAGLCKLSSYISLLIPVSNR